LKKTELPLILVRPGGRRVTRIRKLLVPVDGSPGGLMALQAADAIAQTTGASIKLVEVIVPIPMLAYAAPYDTGGLAFYDSAWDDDALAAARTYVEAVGERMRARGHAVDAEARMAPSVAEGITDTAATGNADLIVMSTHALTGPPRAILGSVADSVVRTSPCPVLLVKRAASRATQRNAPGGQSPC
jgi:nucleotide-binding universal stress UspA family protein